MMERRGRPARLGAGRLAVGVLAAAIGCGCADPREQFGKTWYIDGAGNWGFGVFESETGLRNAGYTGVVDNYRWSLTFNPALDQTLRFVAQGAGHRLGAIITDYLKRNPGAEANLIALSAGTGVGMWAIEQVRPPHQVNHYVMLGSSLSSRYDVSRALKNMKGSIFVYYSASDPVLSGPVRTLGTIDGTFDESAGLVGLRGRGAGGRVVNIGWAPRYERYGWVGGHTDCTTLEMMQHVIARHVVTPEMLREARETDLAQRASSPPNREDRVPTRSTSRPAAARRRLPRPPARKPDWLLEREEASTTQPDTGHAP
jgi:hypothetical protein